MKAMMAAGGGGGGGVERAAMLVKVVVGGRQAEGRKAAEAARSAKSRRAVLAGRRGQLRRQRRKRGVGRRTGERSRPERMVATPDGSSVSGLSNGGTRKARLLAGEVAMAREVLVTGGLVGGGREKRRAKRDQGLHEAESGRRRWRWRKLTTAFRRPGGGGSAREREGGEAV